jgi:hypothetical protein
MKSQPSYLKTLLQDAGLILALITGLLYISGAVYEQSYLERWGINPNLIDFKPQDLLIRGSFNWLIVGFNFLIPLFILAVVLNIIYELVTEFNKSPKLREFSSNIVNALKPDQSKAIEQSTFRKRLKRISIFVSMLFLGALFIVYVYFQILSFSDSQAKIAAEKDYKDFSSPNISNPSIFNKSRFQVISAIRYAASKSTRCPKNNSRGDFPPRLARGLSFNRFIT